MIFNIVFFISLTSVIIQGTTLPLVAKWLHLTLPEKSKLRSPTDIELTDSAKSVFTKIVISQKSSVIGKQIVQLGLPKTTLISFIQRDDKYIIPDGSTILNPNDKLFVLTENKAGLARVFDCLDMQSNS